jgi:hypothetical protein
MIIILITIDTANKSDYHSSRNLAGMP